MTSTEHWLLALAEPESLRADLPRDRVRAPEISLLCMLAEFHGVLPAVLKHVDHLLRNEPERFLANADQGSKMIASLEPARKRLAERSAIAMFLSAESHKLCNELSAAGAEVVVLKGVDFAMRLYRPSALRSFIDVDLLVRPKDWEPVSATMSHLGYVPHETPLKHADGYSERTWEHPAMPGAMVEVHDNLVNSPTVRRGVSVRLEDLPLERAADRQFRATPAGMLLIAAVHGAASHSFDRVQHLCDVAQIVRGRAGVIDENALRECMEKTSAEFCVALALDLTARAFNEPAAADLLARLKPRWPRWLARPLITPALVARAQEERRRFGSWRRQVLRQMLKSRR